MAVHPAEYETKELSAGEALLDGFLIGPSTEHVPASDETRVDGGADRLAAGAQELPVAGHPLLGVLWRLEADAHGPDAETGSEHHGFGARRGHPHGWVRLLQGLGNDVALGHAEVFPLIPGVGDHGHHAQAFAGGFFPRLLLLLVGGQEGADLGGRGALAGPELDAAARHQIEGGDALRHSRRMVLLRVHLDDAMPQPDMLGPRRRGRQKHFGGRRMAVFFEEVMLGGENVVVAKLIGELDLLQRLVVDLELVMLVPLVGVDRSGRLQLEHHAEFHDLISLLKANVSTRAQGRLGADSRHLYVQPGRLSTGDLTPQPCNDASSESCVRIFNREIEWRPYNTPSCGACLAPPAVAKSACEIPILDAMPPGTVVRLVRAR